jgi:polyphosphate kinase
LNPEPAKPRSPIEVLAPVDDPRIRRRVDEIFEALLADKLQSWSLGADGHWSRNEAASDRARRRTS